MIAMSAHLIQGV